MQQFEIRVGIDHKRPEFGDNQNALCHYQTTMVPAGATKSYTCTQPLVGVYIIIQKQKPNPLTLCEVEAFDICKYLLSPHYRNVLLMTLKSMTMMVAGVSSGEAILAASQEPN